MATRRLRSAPTLCIAFVLWFSATAGAQTRLIGYYPCWGNERDGFPVDRIPAEKLTHVHYAFAKVSPDGRLTLGRPSEDTLRTYSGDTPTVNGKPLHGNFGELVKLKRKHPHLHSIISVGGWDWSGGLSKMASTQRGRVEFTNSCLQFITAYDFDGIDIDWEFPVSGGQFPRTGDRSDRQNMTLLVQALRRGLNGLGQRNDRTYELSIAVPAGQENLRHFDLEKLHPELDYLMLMAYDLWGEWSGSTAFHAPLSASDYLPRRTAKRNVQSTVSFVLTKGVPRQKLIVGIPFYGRGVVGASDQDYGLGQRFRGAANGTWGDAMFSYRDLQENYFGTYSCYWDDAAGVGWLFAPARDGLFVSYEDRRSAQRKAEFVHAERLGGMMIWDLTMDVEDPDKSLLETMAKTLTRAPAKSGK